MAFLAFYMGVMFIVSVAFHIKAAVNPDPNILWTMTVIVCVGWMISVIVLASSEK